MKIEILNFAKEKGKGVAKYFASKYSSVDFDISTQEIEKEIYEISLSYSQVFFFENFEAASESSVRDDLLFKVKTFLTEKVNLDKKSTVELLANTIKWYTFESLSEDHNMSVLW